MGLENEIGFFLAKTQGELKAIKNQSLQFESPISREANHQKRFVFRHPFVKRLKRICSLSRISRSEMKNIIYRSQLKRSQRIVLEKFMEDLDSFDEDDTSNFDSESFKNDFKTRLKGKI